MKILSLVLTAVMFSAVACGGSDSGSSNAEVVVDVGCQTKSLIVLVFELISNSFFW